MKRTIKKSLSVFLSVLLIAAGFSTSMIAAAADGFIIENGVLTSYTGTAASVTIPDGVTSIGDDAFRNSTTLTNVTIPSSVTSIGDDAFKNCTTLNSVTIPDNVTEIGNEAFAHCTSLTSVAIGSGVTYMGDAPFYGCTSLLNITVDQNNKNYSSANNILFDKSKVDLIQYPLGNPATSFTVPDGVFAISNNAFDSSTHLTSITIPNGVSVICDEVFMHCTNLTSIIIPNSVTSIGENSFTDTAIYNNPSNWSNNVLYIDGCLIKANTALSGSYAIEPNTRCIASQAFRGTGLTSATIPSSVTSIGISAFDDTPLYNNNANWVNNVLYIDHCLIEAKMQLSGSYIIESATRCVADDAFSFCTALTGVTIPNSVTSIGVNAFIGCSSLTSIALPNSVTSIGYGAFTSCTGLTGITLPSSVTSIGVGAFVGCTNLAGITVDQNNANYSSSGGVLFNKNQTALVSYPEGLTGTSYTVPSSVTSIKNFAFIGFTHLANLTIPNTVTEIEGLAFYGVPSTFVIYCAANSAAYSYAVANAINYTLVSSPEDFTIQNGVLTGYTGTAPNVTIPNSVTSIGDNAFKNCTTLTSVTIPSSVTSIGKNVFWNCSGLANITIPSSVTSIGSYAFHNTPLYENNWTNKVLYIDHCLIAAEEDLSGNYVIASDTTCIADDAFDGCRELTGITIPNSVPSIGTSVFMCCTSLTNITIPSSVTSIGSLAFMCSGLTSITIPSSVTSIGSGAFAACTNLAGITVDQNNANYISKDGVLFNKNQTALISYPGGFHGTNYTVPSSVTSIKSLAFVGLPYLINVTIPNTVTEIEDSAFYEVQSNLTIYCAANSAAQSYAVANSINYTLVNILPANKTVINYSNNRIYTDHHVSTNPQDFISYMASGITVQGTPSFNSYYGTGSTISLYNGSTLVETYTLIVYGDLNGDSVCDVMDAMAASLLESGHGTPTQNQLAAANAESTGIIDETAYQFVVHKALNG